MSKRNLHYGAVILKMESWKDFHLGMILLLKMIYSLLLKTLKFIYLKIWKYVSNSFKILQIKCINWLGIDLTIRYRRHGGRETFSTKPKKSQGYNERNST